MLAFALKRLGLAVLVAFTVSLLSFGLLFLSGDPAAAVAGEGATDADIAAISAFYGFDRPFIVQYGEWLWRRCTAILGRATISNSPSLHLSQIASASP